MDGFEKLQRKYKNLNLNRVLREVWRNPAVQNFIIELNTECQPSSQLFEKGEDSLGVSLGNYTPFTIQRKVEKGQRIDHITLKDLGDFYETWVVIPLLSGFRIEANPDKGGGDNLFEDSGEDVVGLNEQNRRILVNFIHPFWMVEATKVLSQFS